MAHTLGSPIKVSPNSTNARVTIQDPNFSPSSQRLSHRSCPSFHANSQIPISKTSHHPPTMGPVSVQTREPMMQLPPLSSLLENTCIRHQGALDNRTNMAASPMVTNESDESIPRSSMPSPASHFLQQEFREIYENMAIGYFMPPPAQTPSASKPNTCSYSTVASQQSPKPQHLKKPDNIQSFPIMQLGMLSPPISAGGENSCSSTQTLTDAMSPCSVLSPESMVTSPYICKSSDCNTPKVPVRDSERFINNSSRQPTPSSVQCDLPLLESSHNHEIPSNANILSCEQNVLDSILNSPQNNLFSSISQALIGNSSSATVPSSIGLHDIPSEQAILSEDQACTVLTTVQSSINAVPYSSISNMSSSNLSLASCHSAASSADTTTWSKYSVLPPLGSTSATPDFILPNEFASNSAMSNYGFAHPSASPFSITDMSPTTFASPRGSARSSHSGRISRNKRVHSNSPLSVEGLDLNAIIRMSPTSLLGYFNSSHSSSASMSPASGGCYGHLSARNSSSSPRSGSASSGHRMSFSTTPQALVNLRDEFMDLTSNLVAYQSMQALEESSCLALIDNLNNRNSSALSQYCSQDSLQLMDQHSSQIKNKQYATSCMYSTDSHPPISIPPPTKPPPSYDQTMAARKKQQQFQKNKSSSDSSQPSNYSSFESSEGERVLEAVFCQWLDCNAVFQEQEELVQHIEKAHTEQRKGDDFTCYWQGCPRKLKPFNAKYKLHIHMRVHSGEKPNKCTFEGCTKAFSRLENLKIHFRSHTGERPYVCQYLGCSKTFSNSSDRAKHQRTHQDTKPYACQITGCTKRYTDPSSLRKHLKNHTGKTDPARKKLRPGKEEVDPELLSECLTIQAIRPITYESSSPPERNDSGLGRSPRGSQPGSSADLYPSLSFPSLPPSRSGTAQGLSNQPSPSSHQHSPIILDVGEREDKRAPKLGNLRTILPPIGNTSQSRLTGSTENRNLRPLSLSSSFHSGVSRNSGSIPTSPCNQVKSSLSMSNINIAEPPVNWISGLDDKLIPKSECVSDMLPPIEDSFMLTNAVYDVFSNSEGVS